MSESVCRDDHHEVHRSAGVFARNRRYIQKAVFIDPLSRNMWKKRAPNQPTSRMIAYE